MAHKLILKVMLSSGDICTLTAAIESLHATYPGEYITDVRTSCDAIYIQSVEPTSGTWDVDQTWTGNGYLASGTYSLINPVSIAKADKDGRSTDQITSVRTTGSGALGPTQHFRPDRLADVEQHSIQQSASDDFQPGLSPDPLVRHRNCGN